VVFVYSSVIHPQVSIYHWTYIHISINLILEKASTRKPSKAPQDKLPQEYQCCLAGIN
jgi:hypothetical protein